MSLFKKQAPPPPPPKTLFEKGARVEGDLRSRTKVLIRGFYKGTIKTSNKLEIAENGRFEGSASVAELGWAGSGECNLTVLGAARFSAGSSWKGELSTRKLTVEKGASLQGMLREKKS